MSHRSFPRHRHGFTLLDAAFILAVIVVLFAIFYPVFMSARSGGGPSSITCVSHEKQIGLGMMQYAQDYDYRLPPLRSTTAGKPVSWRTDLDPYLKWPQVWRCPDDPAADLPDGEHGGDTRSYAMNSALAIRPDLTLNHLQNASQVIAIVESTSAFPDFDPLKPEIFAKPWSAHTKVGGMYMHPQGSNFLFADGHAKMINPLLTLGASDTEPINYWTIHNSPYAVDDLKKAQFTLGYAVENAQH